MAMGNIQVYEDGAFGYPGDVEYTVAAGAVGTILPGEPVEMALGAAVVTLAGNNFPVVGTDYCAGIAATTSTDTASAAGKVQVTKLVPGMSYLVAPKVAATFDTQAEYDALVGARVLLDLTSTVWTILAADSVNNGCVILPLDIARYPGKVRFAIRAGANILA